MRFIQFSEAATYFNNKVVAIVGSAPSCTQNPPLFIDAHEVVCRINNYRNGHGQGFRCDVFYSFFGTSIKKASGDLYRDGVKLCWCKLPDAKPLESEWHERHNKQVGIDYRYIYKNRKNWWFCDTFIPGVASFLEKFEMLGKHQPTTGFSAILDVLACHPKSVYLTGFDGFTSGLHNVDEPWREKNTDDPICHRPDLELEWLANNASRYPITFDAKLTELLAREKAAA